MKEEAQNPTLSKQVCDRLFSGQTVLDVLRTATPTLIDKLGELFGPWLAGPASPPFASLLGAFDGRLSDCRDRLADAAGLHLESQARAAALDHRGDQAAARLSETMAAMRETFRGIYGHDQLSHFGFPGRTPQRTPVLLERARELQRRLADPDLDLPPSRVPDFDLDCALLARRIAPWVDDLDHSLTAASDHQQQVQESQGLQDEALAVYNEAFLQIARSLESWLRMAGLDDEADRVRPSRRRQGVVLDFKTASA